MSHRIKTSLFVNNKCYRYSRVAAETTQSQFIHASVTSEITEYFTQLL